MGKTVTVEVPEHPVIRYIIRGPNEIDVDFRGIRNPKSDLFGRPNPSKGMKRKYVSASHLQCMVNEYFESCNGPLLDKWGQLVKDNDGRIVKVQTKPYTVSGLALYLGVSTQTLKRYNENKTEAFLDEMKAETDDVLTFSSVVHRAKQIVEAYAEGRLYDKDGQRGAQYVLDCQFNWVGHKEQADIRKSKADTKLKRDEFDLKRKILEDGDEDDNFTINIVRGRREQ